MFEALGRFSCRFKWLVIGLWVVLFGVSLAATPFLEDVLTGGFADPDAPGARAGALLSTVKFEALRSANAGLDSYSLILT